MKTWMNRISNFFLLAFSFLILLGSLRLGMGSVRDPGPGFVPFLASLLLLCLSLVIFVKEIRGSPVKGAKFSFLGGKDLAKPICLMVALIGFAWIFTLLGYLLSTFLLMFTLFSIYQAKRWHVHIAAAALIAGLSFLVFYLWLRVPLPTGLFDINLMVRKWIF